MSQQPNFEERIMMKIAIFAAAAVFALSLPAQAGEHVIATPNAPEAIGPYSQAIQVGNTLYLAGQIAIDPETNEVTPGTIEEETRLVLNNLQAVVEAAGFSMADVVSTSVFMADLAEFPQMNAVYGEFFPEAPPARATVQVARLPRDVKIEISAIAARESAD
jgi:2-iminobutanoate/2-iminopropanoate deaminase